MVDEEPKRGAVPNQQKVIEHFTSPGVHDWATKHGPDRWDIPKTKDVFFCMGHVP
jgi:hypothetical protein